MEHGKPWYIPDIYSLTYWIISYCYVKSIKYEWLSSYLAFRPTSLESISSKIKFNYYTFKSNFLGTVEYEKTSLKS